jgi:hypothetical protein
VSNVADLDELELLHAYKRQPTIEKRFSQLKTDFEVAPVYLKAVHRIQALLAVYFFALLLEALPGTRVASGDAGQGDRGVAPVPGRARLPLADGPAGNRPV